MEDFVTIYITNHNYSKYLKKSIQSVLNQSYKKILLIIIDDNSKDNSKEILKDYQKNEKIKIFLNKKNKGLIKCANLALKNSKGKYIMRLDADDYLSKNAIKYLINNIKNKKKTMMIFPNFFKISEKSKIISKYKYQSKSKYSLYDEPAHGACCLINTNFLKKIGGYNELFDRQDGHYLWYSILSRKKNICHINKFLFYYRMHQHNLSKQKKKILLTRLRIINFFLKRNLFIEEFNYQKNMTKKKLDLTK
ncbi:glycosyltransferase family 2 protein [Pelagibacterales bacterium SAG-MED24]|nr:glycosyltransferase family 2 protein [Pelagibacterales bacterium SAG-MED24]